MNSIIASVTAEIRENGEVLTSSLGLLYYNNVTLKFWSLNLAKRDTRSSNAQHAQSSAYGLSQASK